MRAARSAAVLCALALASPLARADDPQVPAAIAPRTSPGFDEFCARWMHKLAERESANLVAAHAERRDSAVVLTYVGYADEPLRCEARASDVAESPYIGKLVYVEYRYQRTGKTRAEALAAEPEIVAHTEVLEIFRHDGRKWRY